ncbi:hypothetical protein GmHk_14G041343 [Glycine max]|nr:hypothetical protein GmHk_14G041343 [Glycine max]
MCAKARVMSEIEEVEEHMKADMKAMKEQMTTMMETMMSMRKMMEVNTDIVVFASTATEVDPTHPPGFNHVNRLVLDMVGQGGEALGSTGGPHFVQVLSKHSFPPYGMPPNYTPPNVAHAPDKNVDNSAPIPIESQHPQSGHAQVPQPIGETHEVLRDHTVAFIRQYQYNFDMALDRMQLQNMCKREHESFKEYAQKWRDLAAQVAPLMMEREMITMIVEHIYYEKMVGYMPSSFVDLVFAGERIEVGLRRGKFDHPALMNRKPGANVENKKEGENCCDCPQQYQYSANISPSHYPPPYQPRTPNHPQRPPLNQPQNLPAAHPRPDTINTNQNTNQGRNFPENKPIEFTPILVLYANLLPYQLNNAMVAIIPAKIPQPPFSRGHNSNAACAYHGGVPGSPRLASGLLGPWNYLLAKQLACLGELITSGLRFSSLGRA